MKASFEMKIKNNIELIKSEKQKNWGIAAASNFILGGMATGFYLLTFLISFFSGETLNIFQHLSIKLIAPALVTTGFIILTLEAGRSSRSYLLFHNLHRSFMSIEAFAGFIFIFSLVLEYLFAQSLFSILAAVFALLFMISQGFILYRGRAITAWNVPIIPIIIIVSNFNLGSGLVLFLTTKEEFTIKMNLFVIVLILVFLNIIIWHIYLNLYQGSAFQRAIKILRSPFVKIFIVGIGHLLPILLLSLLLLFVVCFNTGFKFLNTISVLTGICILVGGISQKFAIIVGIDYLRGIEIKRTQVK